MGPSVHALYFSGLSGCQRDLLLVAAEALGIEPGQIASVAGTAITEEDVSHDYASELSDEVLDMVFRRLDPVDWLSVEQVCHRWRRIMLSSKCWRELHSLDHRHLVHDRIAADEHRIQQRYRSLIDHIDRKAELDYGLAIRRHQCTFENVCLRSRNQIHQLDYHMSDQLSVGFRPILAFQQYVLTTLKINMPGCKGGNFGRLLSEVVNGLPVVAVSLRNLWVEVGQFGSDQFALGVMFKLDTLLGAIARLTRLRQLYISASTMCALGTDFVRMCSSLLELERLSMNLNLLNGSTVFHHALQLMPRLETLIMGKNRLSADLDCIWSHSRLHSLMLVHCGMPGGALKELIAKGVRLRRLAICGPRGPIKFSEIVYALQERPLIGCQGTERLDIFLDETPTLDMVQHIDPNRLKLHVWRESKADDYLQAIRRFFSDNCKKDVG